MRDVLAGNTTGVERPHGELRTGLTDRVRGDDADGLTEVAGLAGREHAAVAPRTHARHRLAGEHRAHPQPVEAGVVGEQTHDVVVDFRVAGHDRTVGERHVLGQGTTEQAHARAGATLPVRARHPRPRCLGSTRTLPRG